MTKRFDVEFCSQKDDQYLVFMVDYSKKYEMPHSKAVPFM